MAGVEEKTISGLAALPPTVTRAVRPVTSASATMSTRGLGGLSPSKLMRPRVTSKWVPAKS